MLRRIVSDRFKQGLTSHALILALGGFVGLCYFPKWVWFLLLQIPRNASGSFTLTICLVMIGGIKLWQQRHHLALLQPIEADRWLGHSLVIIGVFLFPFCRFALWAEALLWLLILSGMAMSCWGLDFFRTRSGICGAFALTVFPNPGHIGEQLWQALLPAQILESGMAGITTIVLQYLAQPVRRSGAVMLFPQHHVEVGWGCNGFDMALAMIGPSLLIGLYWQFSQRKVLQLISIGIALAVLVNIPRLVLMSLAAVYWGTAAFNFWHGPVGGQIFVMFLLGSYYLLIRNFLLPQQQ